MKKLLIVAAALICLQAVSSAQPATAKTTKQEVSKGKKTTKTKATTDASMVKKPAKSTTQTTAKSTPTSKPQMPANSSSSVTPVNKTATTSVHHKTTKKTTVKKVPKKE